MQSQNVRRVSASGRACGSARTGAGPVVLLVTADEDLRAVAGRVLGREGYRVLTAAHAGHAVLACLEAGRIDVLAAELSMDEISGPSLAARLRRHCQIGGTVYFAQAGTPECEGILVRPFTRDDLLAALATTAAAGAWLPTSSAS